MLKAILIAIVCLVAASLSAALTWSVLDERAGPSDRPIAQMLRLDQPLGSRVHNLDGWSARTASGRRLAADQASLDLMLPGTAAGDLWLTVSVSVPPKEPRAPRYAVAINGQPVGRFHPRRGGGHQRFAFDVPRAVANREFPLRLSLTAEQRPEFPMDVRWLRLKDASGVSGARGFLDGCNRTSVWGWATDDLGPAHVEFFVDGRRTAHALRGLMRKELANHGISMDAGYRATVRSPLAPGAKIEARFRNGQPLRKSPCTVR